MARCDRWKPSCSSPRQSDNLSFNLVLSRVTLGCQLAPYRDYRSGGVALTQTKPETRPHPFTLTWNPATAKGLLELFGKELGMFIDRKIIGIKRLEDMGDDELRQIAGQVIEELDAQVTVDGEVKPVEAELLEPVPTE